MVILATYNVDENVATILPPLLSHDLEQDGQMEYIVAGVIGGTRYGAIHNSGLACTGTRRHTSVRLGDTCIGNGVLSVDDLSIQAPAIADTEPDGLLENHCHTNDGWIRAYKADKQFFGRSLHPRAALGALSQWLGDIDEMAPLRSFLERGSIATRSIYYAGPVGLWAA